MDITQQILPANWEKSNYPLMSIHIHALSQIFTQCAEHLLYIWAMNVFLSLPVLNSATFYVIGDMENAYKEGMSHLPKVLINLFHDGFVNWRQAQEKKQ